MFRFMKGYTYRMGIGLAHCNLYVYLRSAIVFTEHPHLSAVIQLVCYGAFRSANLHFHNKFCNFIVEIFSKMMWFPMCHAPYTLDEGLARL